MEILHDEIKVIASIYSKVLHIDANLLCLESDFFECGGSSLDAIALISLIKAQVGIHVPQNEFFLNPKIVELAICAHTIKSTSATALQLVAVEGSVSEGGKEQWFPASPGQEQMMSCWEMSPVVYEYVDLFCFETRVIMSSLSNLFHPLHFDDNTSMPTTIVISGHAVDVERLREAFLHVVE